MKRNQIIFLVVLGLLMSLFSSLSAVVVIDTLYNVTGNWVINDSVYVGPSGIIQNSGSNFTLTINGGIENNGIIRNNPGGYNLYLEVGGSLSNNEQWSCHSTRLIGPGVQYLSCAADTSYSGSYFYNDNPSNIIAQSHLHFVNTLIDFQNYGSLDLSEDWDWDISLDGGYIYRTTIIGEPFSNSGLYMTNNAYLHSVTASNMTLSGIINIGDGAVSFTGSLINNAIIQNSGSNFTLYIDCDLTNNGTIKNNNAGYNLHLDITGDIINNGDWTNNDIELTGTTDQHIFCPTDSAFSVSNFYGNDSRANIYFDSDVEFDGTIINLNSDNVILQSGMTLTLSGGYLFNGTLTGSAATMNMTDDNYLYSLTIDVDDLELSGICQIANNGVSLNGAVFNNGYLQNRNGNFTLTMDGNITNNGTIRNNPGGYDLYLDISGDITNNSVWTNNDIELFGVDQNITCGYGNTFDTDAFYGNSSSRGDVYFDSNIGFNGVYINLYSDNVILQTGMTLTLSGGQMFNGTLTGSAAAMNMSGDNYIHALTINVDDLELAGICQIADNGVIMNGVVINNGYLQNRSHYHTLTVNGDLTNNGTVRDNPSGYNLYIDISGDIVNNGDWTNNDIELTGTTDQHISCPSDSAFSVSHLYGNNSRANTYFDSDIEFIGTIINLNSDNVILQSGMTLTLSGGYLFNGTLTGSAATMNMSGGNYLYSLNINVDDLELSGICQIADSGVIMNGAVVNNGYLQNRNGNFTLTIDGNITNNGTIWNNPGGYDLYLDISGDIINNSVWTNNDIELKGAGQHISCGVGNSFDINNFYGNSSVCGDVYFDSDIGFSGTNINLNWDNVILQSGMTLSMSGGFMYYGILTGSAATMNMSGGNYLYTLTINIDDLVLSGTCQIADSGVPMNGNVVNNGNLQNLNNSSHTLYLNGDFSNNGTVRNNPSGYNLYTHLKQDVTNNGSWINTTTYINGTTDQTITIHNPNEITGDVRFDSDILTAPYQWRFDGSNLDEAGFAGETTSQLDWNIPIASGWFGTFNCSTGGGLSRNIIVTESGAAPSTPLNLTISIVDPNVVLDWDDVTGATSYTVYSDSDPYGSFGDTEYTGAASTCTLSIPGDEKFYRITASN